MTTMSLQILFEYRRRCKPASALQVRQITWWIVKYLIALRWWHVLCFSANTTGSFNRRCLSCNFRCGYVSGSFSPDANYFFLNCKGFMLFLLKSFALGLESGTVSCQHCQLYFHDSGLILPIDNSHRDYVNVLKHCK